VAIDVLLAFLRPGYSLIYNAESDYGRGPWYWVMDLNFLLRCTLSLAIAEALYRTVRLGGRARGGLALLVTWAICSGLLAFFADDPEGTPQHGSGIVHLVLAFIALTAIAIGAILISASLMSDPAWRPAAPVLLAISVAGAIAYLLLGVAARHHHAPGGLYERIFLGLELLWIVIAAIALTRRTQRKQTQRQVQDTKTVTPRNTSNDNQARMRRRMAEFLELSWILACPMRVVAIHDRSRARARAIETAGAREVSGIRGTGGGLLQPPAGLTGIPWDKRLTCCVAHNRQTLLTGPKRPHVPVPADHPQGPSPPGGRTQSAHRPTALHPP
jgi:hypothetical membrane protein